MPDAEDLRLQSAYERAVRTGDQASARALFSQMEERADAQAAARRAEREQVRTAQQFLEGYAPTPTPVSYIQRGLLDVEPGTSASTPDPFTEMVRETAAQQPRRLGLVEDLLTEMRTGSRPYNPELLNALRNARRAVNRNQETPFQLFMSDTAPFLPRAEAEKIQELVNKKPQLAEKIFNTGAAVNNKITNARLFLQNAKNKIIDAAVTAKTNYRIPNVIAGPLGLYNPTVQPGGIIEPGTKLNPEASAWLSRQTGSPFDTSLEAMGGTVNIRKLNDDLYDIGFMGATEGYVRPKDIKENIKKSEIRIAELQKELSQYDPKSNAIDIQATKDNIDFLESENARQLSILQKVKENPLSSEAIRYQLGRGIEQIPSGSTIRATPIGGSKGARARLYRALSDGALETQPYLRPNPNQYPTEAEFRAASLGGGMRLSDLRNFNRGAELIQTQKTGPTEFFTWEGKPVDWDPSTLKDPMIRAAFNLPAETDVSTLRSAPMSQFINTRPIDFNRPVISTSSPQYIAQQGVKAGIKTVKPATKALLLDAAINYGLGASPKEAFVTALSDPISAENLGGAPTAAIERLGPQGQFVDTRTNTVLSPQGLYTDTGIAYRKGKPVIVPRGSVAGEGNILTQSQQLLQNAAAVWKKRLGGLGIFGR